MSGSANDIGVLANVLTPIGFEQLSITGGTVKTPTVPTVPEGVDVLAIIQCEDGDCRWRDDGTVPNASTGFVLFNRVPLQYNVRNFPIKFIQPNVTPLISAGTIVNINYYTYASADEVG